jgi:hypothetical protein
MSVPVPKAPVLILLLLIFFSGKSFHGFQADDKCNTFLAEVNVKEYTQSPGRYDVSVKAKGGIPPYKYVFIDPSLQVISFNFEDNKLAGLVSGDYRCIVYDKQSCKHELYFEVK